MPAVDDPLLLEVDYLPFYLNNKTILDDKCPPGWSLMYDTCYMYVGAPMTFYEARDFCRSDNATMPFIRGSSDMLWLYLQRQMAHLRYPEKIWIQDLNYLDQCTSFIYRNIESDDCNAKRGFVCEIDPKVFRSREARTTSANELLSHFRLQSIRFRGKPMSLQ